MERHQDRAPTRASVLDGRTLRDAGSRVKGHGVFTPYGRIAGGVLRAPESPKLDVTGDAATLFGTTTYNLLDSRVIITFSLDFRSVLDPSVSS